MGERGIGGNMLVGGFTIWRDLPFPFSLRASFSFTASSGDGTSEIGVPAFVHSGHLVKLCLRCSNRWCSNRLIGCV